MSPFEAARKGPVNRHSGAGASKYQNAPEPPKKEQKCATWWKMGGLYRCSNCGTDHVGRFEVCPICGKDMDNAK